MKNNKNIKFPSSRMITASAGAGKTYTLARSVVDALAENRELTLSQVLLITFTNKAAAEMEKAVYQNVQSRLDSADSSEADHWQKILMDFNTNSIQTFDSFFGKILRSYGPYAGLDPNFTILSKYQNEKLESDLKNQVRQNLLAPIEKNEPWLSIAAGDWGLLLDSFGSAPSLIDFVIDLARPDDKHIKFVEFMEKEINKTPEALWRLFREQIFLPWIDKKLKYDQAFIRDLSNEIIEIKKLGLSKKSQVVAINSLEKMLALSKDCEENRIGLLHTFLTEKLDKPRGNDTPAPFSSLVEKVQRIRNKYREKISDKNFYLKIIDPFPPEEWSQLLTIIKALIRLVNYVNVQLVRNKQQIISLEFDDVRKWCYELIMEQKNSGNSILEMIGSKYKYVFIDEFQDTAPSQFEIITSIFDFAQVPVFIVGDEKQSIYRFRGAEIRLTGTMRSYLNSITAGQLIEEKLTYNFRSFPDMIRYFNSLFGYVFKPPPYQEDFLAAYQEQDFPEQQIKENLKNKFDPWENAKIEGAIDGLDESVTARVEYYTYEKIQDIIPAIVAAVQRILASKQSQQFISENVQDPLIGILLPTTGIFLDLEAAFDAQNIPYTMFTKGFYQTSEIVALQNLLKYFSEPHDVYHLTALLKSELVGLPETHLNMLIEEKTSPSAFFEKCEKRFPAIYGRIQCWLFWYKNLPLKEVLWKVIEDSPVNYALSGEQHAREKIANINKFISELPDLPIQELCPLFAALSTDESVEKALVASGSPVNVMTIHKSKGLKFQHVITVTPTEKGHRDKGRYWSQFSHHSGSAYLTLPKLFNKGEHFKKSENVLNSFTRLREKEESLEEKKRMVYVAHTRAVQGLIIFNETPPQKYQISASDRFFPANAVLWNYFNSIQEDDSFQAGFTGATADFLKIGKVLPDDNFLSGLKSEEVDSQDGQIFWPEKKAHRRLCLALNASKLSDYLLHPNNREIEKINDFESLNQATSFGTKFHQFMEMNIHHVLSGNLQLIPEIEADIQIHLANLLQPLQQLYINSLVYPETEICHKCTMAYQNTEYEITVSGIVDLVLLTPEKKYVLLDYKTGKMDVDTHALQLAVYAHILNKGHRLPIANAALVYSSPEYAGEPMTFVDETSNYKEFKLEVMLQQIIEKLHPDLMSTI